MNNLTTPRLSLSQLTLTDSEFVRELVNTPAWIKFIGNRNINTPAEALPYTQKLIDDPNVNYWVVKLKESHTPVGAITLIKHDYLEHWDIGFAFLELHSKQGFAFEAASIVLNNALKDPLHPQILAVCLKENFNSIKLLGKLGLRFSKEFEKDNEVLLLFQIGSNDL